MKNEHLKNERLPGESFEAYRERRKSTQRALRDYLKGRNRYVWRSWLHGTRRS